MYFKGVWSRFKIRESGIWYLSTTDAILCKYRNSASFLAPSGISTFPVVFILLLKPILLNRRLAQLEESKSIWFNRRCGLRAINAFAVDMAIVVDTKPPLPRNAIMKFCTIWSKLSKSKGLPRDETLRLLLTWRFCFFAIASSPWYNFANLRALLSFNGFSLVPNFFAAATPPFMDAYFPISYRSLSDHFWRILFFSKM